MENKAKRIEGIINGMSGEEKRTINNEYCYQVNDCDREIFTMDMIDEVFEGQEAGYILNRAFYGNFNPNHDYFRFDGYGNLESFYDFDIDAYIYSDEIANWIVENGDSLGFDEIEEILNEDEEEEEN